MAEGAERDRIFEIMAARNRIVFETWDETLCDAMLTRMADARMPVRSRPMAAA
jgi:hypothetical protein